MQLERVRLARRPFARDPALFALTLLIFAAIALFVALPLVEVLRTSVLTGDGAWTTESWRRLLSRPLYRDALANSIGVGLVTGAISTALGFVIAFLVTRTPVRGKQIMHLLAMLPIISPPFVTAVAILFLFGLNGLVTHQLLGLVGFSIYGFRGVVFSQVLTFTPIAYLALRGVLQAIDGTLEDASLNLGATRWQTFCRVTLPLCAPGIAGAFLVVFIESLADFGNPLVLAGARFPMLAPQAYLEITGSFDLPAGAALAAVLLIPSLTAFAIQRRYLARRQYVTVTGKPARATQPLASRGALRALMAVAWFFFALVIAFYAVILLGALTRVWGTDYTPTLGHFRYVFDVGFSAVEDTLIIALISTPVSGLLGMLVAYLVVRHRFPGRRLLEFGAILNFAVPGTVVGIGYILAFNGPPLVLTGTLAILVLAFVFRYMPVGTQSAVALLRQVDPSIEEAARNLGAGSLTTFRKITLPLIAPAFFTGLVYAFVRAMTAISAAIFLVSAHWNLMTVQILSQVGSGRLGVAAAFSVLLIAIVIVAIVVIDASVNRIAHTRIRWQT